MRLAIYAVLVIVIGWMLLSFITGPMSDVQDLREERQQTLEKAIKDATG
jgi:hypothetical protein